MPISAPVSPPTAPPTPTPASAAIIGPAAINGPKPGIASAASEGVVVPSASYRLDCRPEVLFQLGNPTRGSILCSLVPTKAVLPASPIRRLRPAAYTKQLSSNFVLRYK